MNDLIEAAKERIKAPYFGYCFLAFVFINWRAFYILFKTKGLPVDRLAAFDASTTSWNLIFWPFFLGGVAFFVRPWFEFLFEYVSRKPKSLVMDLNLRSENFMLLRKTELEDARLNFLAQKERSLIERAKRDEEIDGIDNEKLKADLKREVDKVRHEIVGEDEYFSKDKIAAKILGYIANEGNGIVEKAYKKGGLEKEIEYIFGLKSIDAKNRYYFLKVEDVLNTLIEKSLLKQSNDKSWVLELTLAGWETAEELGLLN
ncbi:MAG: hypothetical protein ACTJH7_00380 [Alcaligenes sp.]